MNLNGKKVIVHDNCLRDGMHAKKDLISIEEMIAISTGLDDAGVPLLEVTHGHGLGGRSLIYGIPSHSDEEYFAAVIPRMKTAKVSALMVPGIGTVDHMIMAKEMGVSTLRIATHCTEADVCRQHIEESRRLGFDTVTFLMMAHMASPKVLAEQAKLMESYGAECIYITDSAGYMLQKDTYDAVSALREVLDEKTAVGFHGHNNLSLGVTNSLAAIEAGATRIDGSAAGMGAGAGNTPLEVFVAVCDRMGIETGVDLNKIMDVAEDIVTPILDEPIRIDRDSLTIGYAGVYSSFLHYAKRAEIKYKVPARELLVELGRRGIIGGQEDMVEDTALEMSKKYNLQAS